ncbi:LysR family transcriptional regulator [Nonomuraea aridisoli]|uniref:LysR family transcriptional regulator n=1 Tax=Nonomuraea aridisoli TaxID=2070368 RepID=A0A2W2DQJ0_9ACTN|nr:LysR family transcriptional regulator [Nonomuraea aridisoli]
METRELECFVAVAEELHFGRAAERLGVAQPLTSRTIARLERRLGVRLFERTSRRVELTAAGRVLLSESRRALDAVDAAVRRTQRAARRRRLVVATRAGTGSGLLAGTLRAYEGLPGAVAVEVVFTPDQVAALRTGAADLALMCGRGELDGLARAELTRESSVALLPPGHRLAGRAALTHADLAGEAAYRDHRPDESLDQIVELVSYGRLIAVVGASAADRIGDSVAAVPVPDLPDTRVVLAWRDDTPDAARALFVRTATVGYAHRFPAGEGAPALPGCDPPSA